MAAILSPHELEEILGNGLKSLRLQKNLDQISLSERAGVSLTALKHLESGQGANIKTLVRVVRALNRAEWIQALAPEVSINPLHMLRQAQPRQRARRRNKNEKKST
jgi:transcriptional regulator with XRE-family HTH domain